MGLKLKLSKCNFFKSHIEYIEHLISGTGIYPLKQKDQAILDLAPSSNVMQGRHILGLASYYRKFIPMFSSIVSLITSLTKKNIPFVWTAACQTAFDTIKHAITHSPVLTYPDPNKQYHLFTDASNHTWSGELTQTRETLRENGKLYLTYHPIMYQSGTFALSQINWSTLLKEAYAIMMSFCKMAFYLHDAEVVIQSDHAPLQKLIKHKPKNVSKQNWDLEMFPITPYITFQHIKDKDNILADSLSHLQCLGLYEKSIQKNLVKNMALQYLMKEKLFRNMHNQRLQTSKPPNLTFNTHPIKLNGFT